MPPLAGSAWTASCCPQARLLHQQLLPHHLRLLRQLRPRLALARRLRAEPATGLFTAFMFGRLPDLRCAGFTPGIDPAA